ncbi:Gfo/Idh/MocA family protein [Streptomyces arenae]|uniref:Gfo/Idh/MocA family protein n=1 Tax=Streptomyces arenae TaxID=29301 RepID=UPI00265A0FB8|nr:Gfo/Idh/MocA family oxidoreductase [Streptomyces arenae]MCG7208489.1 Gfo/Idh/MocA family oxidoreductase [Streptomyces arenae]
MTEPPHPDSPIAGPPRADPPGTGLPHADPSQAGLPPAGAPREELPPAGLPHVVPSQAGPVRAGFIGGGFMAAVHTRASRAAGGRQVALASSTAARGEQAARQLGAERAEPDARGLTAAGDLDIVHVCSPNSLHHEHTLAALAAGAHVICEKPLATTAADAGELVRAARAADRIGAVPFVYRYHPMARQARALVADGRIGTVLTLDAAYLQDWLLDPGDTNWRADPGAGGAPRAFADIGSHLCDLVEFVSGQRIHRLAARTRTVFGRRGDTEVTNEDTAALLVELGDGALGTLLVSQLAPGRKNSLTLELHGTRRSVRFEQERPEELWVGGREGSQLLLRDPATAAPDSARLSVLPPGHALGYQDAFTAFVTDVYRAVRGETPEGMPTFADGLRAARLTEAVLASAARQGTWIETPPETEDPV